MISHPAFAVEPWCLRATGLDPHLLAQTESLFAVSNGHIGWRGNLDEGEPYGLPGSYLSGLYELHPLPYGEAGFGFPESGQTMLNATNGKLIRLLVDDEPFDVRDGTLSGHERRLDFRTGLLHRTADWVSAAGGAVRVTSTRLVSLTQRSIGAIRYQVEAVNRPLRIVLQSELVANEELPPAGGDPRATAWLQTALVGEEYSAPTATSAGLVHRTRRSGLRVAVAMDHVVEGPEPLQVRSEALPDLGRVTVSAILQPGQRLRLVKFVAHSWSGAHSSGAVRDQAAAALAAAMRTGWEGLVAEQCVYLDDYWAGADVEIDGDPQVQQAARFALFHVLQAGARAEGRAIPAKGLTGSGYDGHSFWDTESFVLPVLMYSLPQTVANALRWRHSTLGLAVERAGELGLAGAAFPWRTIHGEECSGYWPASTAAFHVGADVAAAAVRYVEATGDVEFERDVGLELLAETARLWCSLGYHNGQGRFRIDGVTGPDEYSALADNNVYTNLMAQQNLRAAAEAGQRHLDRARQLGIDDAELTRWQAAADAMFVPYDEVLGVHPQAESFTTHRVWDFATTPAEHYPLMHHFHYFDLYRQQVVKQADLVLAMQHFPEAFTTEQKARNFAYYEKLTVRDSSLSACSQAVMAAEVGHLKLAHDYLGEAALMDLGDLEHNSRDGLHIASLAGVWTALVAGFGGMRANGGVLRFAPRLPEALTGLAFRMRFAGRRLLVQITPAAAAYLLLEGPPLTVFHFGHSIVLTAGERLVQPIPRIATLAAPTQPHGRAPARRDPDRSLDARPMKWDAPGGGSVRSASAEQHRQVNDDDIGAVPA